jgi:hypothetical protein
MQYSKRDMHRLTDTITLLSADYAVPVVDCAAPEPVFAGLNAIQQVPKSI